MATKAGFCPPCTRADNNAATHKPERVHITVHWPYQHDLHCICWWCWSPPPGDGLATACLLNRERVVVAMSGGRVRGLLAC
jgi:hypothetical protein